MSETPIFRPNVVLCGENPQIILIHPNKHRAVATASFWRCTYSPCGEGNILLVHLSKDVAKGTNHPPTAIYTDQPAVARYITDTFNQHFEGWKKLGLPTVEPRTARFFFESDSRQYYRIGVHTEDQAVTLIWRDVRPPELRMFPDINGGGFGIGGDEHYDVQTVISLCGSASIQIGSHLVGGEVQTADRNGRFMSSAFLAFSEVWLKRDVPDEPNGS